MHNNSCVVKVRLGRVRHSARQTMIAQGSSVPIEWETRAPSKHFAERRHFDVRMNYIMECVKNEIIKIMKVDTQNNLANFLTKPLTPEDCTTAMSRHFIFKSCDQWTSIGLKEGCCYKWITWIATLHHASILIVWQLVRLNVYTVDVVFEGTGGLGRDGGKISNFTTGKLGK